MNYHAKPSTIGNKARANLSAWRSIGREMRVALQVVDSREDTHPDWPPSILGDFSTRVTAHNVANLISRDDAPPPQ
jgi:hypothetical protein